MKSFYLLLVATAIAAVSCKTKEGEPGPAGESGLYKQGSIAGTISYTNANSVAATTTFNYQYYESIEDNYFTYDEYNSTDSYYDLEFARRDLKDNNSYFYIDIEGYSTNGVEDAPDYVYSNFNFITLVNNEIQEFSGDDIDITNFNLDHTTGRATFNYTGTAYDANDNLVTITGTADISLNRLRQTSSPSIVHNLK